MHLNRISPSAFLQCKTDFMKSLFESLLTILFQTTFPMVPTMIQVNVIFWFYIMFRKHRDMISSHKDSINNQFFFFLFCSISNLSLKSLIFPPIPTHTYRHTNILSFLFFVSVFSFFLFIHKSLSSTILFFFDQLVMQESTG